MSKKRPTSPLTWGVLVGFLFGVLSFLGVLFWNIIWQEAIVPQPCVTTAQIQAIAAGIRAYETEHGRRPPTLEALVAGKYCDKSDCFDERKGRLPEIDQATGRFASNPDVIYFPAVRRSDPPELVVLCTLLKKAEADPYLVVRNDGQLVELTARELVPALQRTYTYLGRDIYYPAATAGSAPTEPRE
ncbi:MAG TPA: hypothetical protein DCX07_04210 [Phycisphaerales bacterium]|nr:hypothetical protein [Phycisphaerales bacterium]